VAAAALLTRIVFRCGRRSRVILTPQRWRQVARKYSLDDGVNSLITGESMKETVKTIVCGNAG
jgi:hypothetical protein